MPARCWRYSFIRKGQTVINQATVRTYKTQNVIWRAAERQFSDWTLRGTRLSAEGALALDPEGLQPGKDIHKPGGYNGRNFFNGGDFLAGEAVSPPAAADFGFTEGIASWSADTPDGSWVETQMRVQIGERWTEWYSMGVWAATCSTVERHSVGEQSDTDATISTDTLVLKEGLASTAFQIKLRLFTVDPKV